MTATQAVAAATHRPLNDCYAGETTDGGFYAGFIVNSRGDERIGTGWTPQEALDDLMAQVRAERRRMHAELVRRAG